MIEALRPRPHRARPAPGAAVFQLPRPPCRYPLARSLQPHQLPLFGLYPFCPLLAPAGPPSFTPTQFPPLLRLLPSAAGHAFTPFSSTSWLSGAPLIFPVGYVLSPCTTHFTFVRNAQEQALGGWCAAQTRECHCGAGSPTDLGCMAGTSDLRRIFDLHAFSSAAPATYVLHAQ